MPRPIHRLTDKQCQHARPGKVADGGGLFLRTLSSGASRWVFQYTRDGRTREMGLGSYPTTSLAKARADAERCRKNLAAGRDPIEARKAKKAEKAAFTFTQAAAAYIRAHRRGWSNAKHARQWARTLKTYARPKIGQSEIGAVSVEDVLAILTPIWLSKGETAKRVQGRIEAVIDFAAARGWRAGDNPARWRGHLDKLLAAPGRVRKVRHHPAMPYADLPGFVAKLRATEGTSARALEFLVLTACRTGEVLGATWDEFDVEGRVWTVPPARMKAKREHRVPLSDAALAVLERVDHVVGNPFVFAGARHGRPLSNMALLQLMRGMGYGVGGDSGDYVPHGFRSSFRDWAEETTGFPSRVCEAALAHTVGDKTVAAYQRGDLFEKRRLLMATWGAYCAAGARLRVVSAK